MKLSTKIIGVPLVALFLTACGSDNDNDPGNIVEVAKGNGSFNTLVTALEATGLDTTLGDEARDFTVFAPTDAAFSKLDPTDLAALLNDPDALSDILLYHVLAGAEIDSSTAISAAGTTLTMANSDDVGVALNEGNLFINASQVIETDVNANNGIIHAIDTVLIPTTDNPASGNIAEVATAAGTFNTLLGALTTTGLDSVLTDPAGKFTVFAPTDAAFAALGDISGLSVDELENILLYHVVVGREINAAAATAIAGNTITMGNTAKLALSSGSTNLFANLSVISGTDDDASNGIIHTIDTVLIPPAETTTPTLNIVETAQADPNLSTLVTALLATSDLVTTLSNENSSFTVFAPTNDAFDALPAGTLDTLLTNPDGALRDILMKHVVSGSVHSVTAFTLNGTAVPTANVNGETVDINIQPGQFFVDTSEVTTFDIQATNGTIHVIDTVILLD